MNTTTAGTTGNKASALSFHLSKWFSTRSVVWKHALAWLVYIVYAWLGNLLVNPDEQFLDIVFANLLSMLAFYSGYFSLHLAFFNKQPVKGILLWIVGFGLFCAGRYVYVYVLLDLINVKPYTTDNTQIILRDSIFLYTRFFLYSIGFYYARKVVLKERQLRVAEEEKHRLQEEKLQLEKMNLQTEYAFLRSQINPHFLQNTLNFFYSKSMHVARQLSDGILLLAEIMRYAQVADESGDGKVLLSREVEHLKNIIKINQLRFSDSLYIHFNLIGNMDGIRVIPFVLISLAENTLKHGELREADHPAIIELMIDEAQQRLYFCTSNKKSIGPKEPSSGIGLVNIRKRLELMYGGNFTLEITEGDDLYTTYLELKY